MDAFRDKARELDATFGGERRRHLTSIIRPAGQAGEDLLDAAATGGLFVTTGQQPGLFGGPLYTLYKALTAVRLAEHLTGILDRPVMPLFWVASDDHDWEEANHTHLLGRDNEVARLSLGERPGEADAALSHTPLGPGVVEALDQLAEVIPDTEFTESWMTLLRSEYRAERTVSESFKAVVTRLLAGTPIGIVDAADPALKAAARPVMLRELESAAEGEAVLAERSAALDAAGYATQVALLDQGVNLFLEDDTGRHRLFRDGSGFRLGRSGRLLEGEDVKRLLRDDASPFSPNVLLRPVAESYLFPTLSYVGGPGEIAYFGQLGPFFEHHGVGAPMLTPRASFMVAEAKVDKVLEKFGLEASDLRDTDGLLTRMAREDLPEDVVRALGKWRGAIGELSKELTGAVATVDPTLKGAVAAVRNAGFAGLGDLEKKVVQAVKRENETMVAQIRKAEANLWPKGSPQDRVLNPLHFLSRFGDEFITAAQAEIQVELGVETG